MFGRATITLGIGPHSSLLCYVHVSFSYHYVVNKVLHKVIYYCVILLSRDVDDTPLSRPQW